MGDDVEEIWKDIPAYPGYQASSNGRIRSYWNRGTHTIDFARSPTMRKCVLGNVGYYCLPVKHESGKVFTRPVAYLVLLTFVGERPEGLICCHNNGIRTDNRLVNLRWDTYESNKEDQRKHGTLLLGEDCKWAKLKETDVRQARIDYSQGVSIKVLSERYGVHYDTMRGVVKRDDWKHIS